MQLPTGALAWAVDDKQSAINQYHKDSIQRHSTPQDAQDFINHVIGGEVKTYVLDARFGNPVTVQWSFDRNSRHIVRNQVKA